MLDEDTRNAVLKLHQTGQSKRAIAIVLDISRDAVSAVLKSGTKVPPPLVRSTPTDSHKLLITQLFIECKGNFVRVQERLTDEKIVIAYSTLTQFCRRQQISKKAKKASGAYHFGPGQEMQHDTSPHRVKLGDKVVKMQCASLVMCYSRKVYAQVFYRWTRLEARQFLTEALLFFGGASAQCMVDNSNVVLSHGSGKFAVIAAEMEALGKRFGFVFIAHEVGDANRSARVERPFHYIENNFYPGRNFSDRDDCNAQLRDWCEEKSGIVRKKLHASPRELHVSELPHLQPLPRHVPEIYEAYPRTVDGCRFVSLHTNLYSVPAKLIDRDVQVRECKDKVRVFLGPRQVAEHPLLPPGGHRENILTEHRHLAAITQRQQRLLPVDEEVRLRKEHPDLSRYVDGLRQRHAGRAVGAMRRLLRIWLGYPQAPVLTALTEALHYGQYDLARLEKMVLRRVAGQIFGFDPARDGVVDGLDFEEE